MRVAIVSRIYRPEPAAASLFLGAVADELIDRGHRVEVLTVAPPTSLPTDRPREHVRAWPALRDRNGYVRGYVPYLSFDLPLVLRLLVLRRPDVVVVEPPPTTGAVVRLICALRRIPYVYDAADIWSDAADLATGSRTVLRVVRMIERFALRGAARIVTISQGVVERARALGARAPIVVTGFGADTSAFSVTEAETDRVFVYGGSYSAWHGADVLVPAFAEFLTTHPDYTLEFVGHGTERESIAALARHLGVGHAVRFAEPVSPAELSLRLARATASLATLKPDTRYTYAFASKTYSSMASGCPVIFAGPGPTAAFVETANAALRAGAAVPYDAAAIADAMREIADSPLSASERVALGQWTAREHSMQAVARRVADVVEAAGERTAS
jgi:glycosyltransferase involved in cell wall biosynthesis